MSYQILRKFHQTHPRNFHTYKHPKFPMKTIDRQKGTLVPRLGVLVLDVFELSASRFYVLELGLTGLPVPGLSV